MRKALHEMWQDKTVRKLAWSIVVIILTFLVQYLTNMPWEIAPLLVLIIREITKHINMKYLDDLGVDKDMKTHNKCCS